jgi:hypothetical protein
VRAHCPSGRYTLLDRDHTPSGALLWALERAANGVLAEAPEAGDAAVDGARTVAFIYENSAFSCEKTDGHCVPQTAEELAVLAIVGLIRFLVLLAAKVRVVGVIAAGGQAVRSLRLDPSAPHATPVVGVAGYPPDLRVATTPHPVLGTPAGRWSGSLAHRYGLSPADVAAIRALVVIDFCRCIVGFLGLPVRWVRRMFELLRQDPSFGVRGLRQWDMLGRVPTAEQVVAEQIDGAQAGALAVTRAAGALVTVLSLVGGRFYVPAAVRPVLERGGWGYTLWVRASVLRHATAHGLVVSVKRVGGGWDRLYA